MLLLFPMVIIFYYFDYIIIIFLFYINIDKISLDLKKDDVDVNPEYSESLGKIFVFHTFYYESLIYFDLFIFR